MGCTWSGGMVCEWGVCVFRCVSWMFFFWSTSVENVVCVSFCEDGVNADFASDAQHSKVHCM